MGEWAGFFISLEGVDGSGKSTQARVISSTLHNQGHETVTVRDPGGTAFGELMRNSLLQHEHIAVDPWAEVLAFIASRVQLLREVVMPALAAGKIVISERFVDSTFAYQGGGRGLDIEALRRLHHDACGDIWPDLTIWLDLPLDIAETRRKAQELSLDRIEKTPRVFHAAVDSTFRALAVQSPDRIVGVDATLPANLLSQQIIEIVVKRLHERIAVPH